MSSDLERPGAENKNLRALLEFNKNWRLRIILPILGGISNDDWQEIKKHDPSLFRFVVDAVNNAK